MGEEHRSRSPFLFFTNFHDELAEAVREGRRSEFEGAPGFTDPEARHRIPDPNHPDTFEQSRVRFDLSDPSSTDADALAALARTRRLIALRRAHIVPRLEGARSLGAEAVGPKAVVARWHMGDGAVLTIAVNLDADEVEVPAHRFHMRGQVLFASPDPTTKAREGCLPGHTTWVVMQPAT